MRKLKLFLATLAMIVGGVNCASLWANETFTETYTLTGRNAKDWSSMLKKLNAADKTFDVFVNGTKEHVLVWGGTTEDGGLSVGGRSWGATAFAFRNVSKGDKVAITVADANTLSALSLYANSDKISIADNGATRTFTVVGDGVSVIEINFPANGTRVHMTQIQYTYELPDGFTKVTSADELTAENFANNYYLISAETYPSLVLAYNTTRGGDGYTDLSYAAQNVNEDLYQLWTLEKFESGFSMRNVKKDNLLLQTESYGAYPIRLNDQPNPCTWTQILPASDSNDGFTFQWGNKQGNYFGLWTPTNDYFAGEYLAGNKSEDAQKGHFNIYSIPRATFNEIYAASHVDITDLMLNPSVANIVGWGGGNTASGQQYTGAPDNIYLDRNNAEMNTNQGITLPAGDYIVKAATRASVSQSNGHLYVYTSTSSGDIDSYPINKEGNTGNVLGNGWDWTMMAFTLTETTNVGIGFYMGKSSWAGVDDWHLYKVNGSTPSDVITAFNSKLKNDKQNVSVKEAATTAISTLSNAWSVANFKDARTKVDASKTSVANYAKMKAEIDEAAEICAATNVYTKAAKTELDAYATGYDNGTLTDNQTGTIMGNRSWRQNNLAISKFLLSAWNATSSVAQSNTWGDYYVNTWSVEGDTDGSNLTEPFYEYFVQNDNVLGDKTLTATLTSEDGEGVKANTTYQVSALVRLRVSSSSNDNPIGVTLQVGEGTAVDVCTDLSTTSSGGYLYRTVTAYGASDADGKLTIKFNVNGTNCSWLAFKNVKYTKVEVDLSTLKEAIDAADAKTLGFADGEYAPYNNTAMLSALASAKELYSNAAGKTQEDINNAKETLNSAVSAMKVNVGEVSAIYWPAYTDESAKDADNRIYALGWGIAGGTDADNTRVVIGTETSNKGIYQYLENQEALMTKFGTTYGEETGYTMPLKANTLYKLSFKYGGMEDTPTVTVSLTDPLSNTITLAPNFTPKNASAHNSSETDQFETYAGYFMTNAAGNYVLRFTKSPTDQQQIAMGNIDLRTAEALEFADDAVPTYAPGTYPAVKISRTLTADRWATAVYPFAVSGVDNIVELTDYDANTGKLKFSSVDNSTVNKPFLMKSNNGTNEITLSNVAVAAAAPVDVTFDGLSLKGVYAQTTIKNETDDNVYYAVSNNVISPVSEATVPAYRAYIEMTTTPARSLTFVVDDETTTAIEGLSVEHSENGNFYNLNGQRVNKAHKGLYIINGKKVVMK